MNHPRNRGEEQNDPFDQNLRLDGEKASVPNGAEPLDIAAPGAELVAGLRPRSLPGQRQQPAASSLARKAELSMDGIDDAPEEAAPPQVWETELNDEPRMLPGGIPYLPPKPVMESLVLPEQMTRNPAGSAMRRMAERARREADSLELIDFQPVSPVETLLDDGRSGGGGRRRQETGPRFSENKIRNLLADVDRRENKPADPEAARRRRKGAGIAALVLFAVGLAGMAWYFRGGQSGQVARQAEESRQAMRQQTVADEEAARPAKLAAATAVLKAFLTPGDAAARSAHLVEGSRLAPLLARHEAALGPLAAEVAGAESEARLVDMGGKYGVQLPVKLASGEKRTAVLVEMKEGFKIDLLSLMTPELMTWKEFCAKKPEEPQLFRLRLTGAEAPRGGAEQASRWKCWGLQRAGETAPLVASAPVGSRVAQELDRRLAAGAGPLVSVHLAGDYNVAGELNPAAPAEVKIVDVIPE